MTLTEHELTPEDAVPCGEDKKIQISIQSEPQGVPVDLAFGRAARFVKRAVNAMRSTKLHYYPTPGQTMFRIQDHAARVQALGKQFITDKQRAAALQVIWSAYFEVAQIDSLQERRDPQAPVPAGDGQHLWRLSRDTGCYVAQPVRDADSYQRPGLDHYGRMPMQNEDDDRYGMRDPVLELSRYTINPRIIHLTQREDARFELNNQRWIMDNLRGLERRLWPKNVNRTARETITLRST